MNITIYLALSVNGMISNKRNVPDWLSQEYSSGFASISQQKKAVIMGKTTYNILAPDYLPLKNKGTLIVLTHDRATGSEQSNVIFTNKDPMGIVKVLESRGHEEAVIIGGAETTSAFLKSGLADEIILVVEPFIFGMGLPLLKDVDDDYDLVLSDIRKLNESTVQLHYRLKK